VESGIAADVSQHSDVGSMQQLGSIEGVSKGEGKSRNNRLMCSRITVEDGSSNRTELRTNM
jgi:hypothetical protein